jgi:DNA-binding response OmpR family regulator
LKKTILVIENDDAIKEVVSMLLEAEGFTVIAENYAPFDLTRIKADLILIDEWVNRVEGHMLCKEIKAIAELAKIPVIIFSTASNVADIVKTCRANGFVRKPFDVDALLSEINKHLTFGLTETV